MEPKLGKKMDRGKTCEPKGDWPKKFVEMIIGIDVLRINGTKKCELIDIRVTGIRADPVQLLSASTSMGTGIPGDAAPRRYHRLGVMYKIAF